MVLLLLMIFILIKKFSILLGAAFAAADSTSLGRQFDSSLGSGNDADTSLVIVLMGGLALGTTEVMCGPISGLLLLGLVGL